MRRIIYIIAFFLICGAVYAKPLRQDYPEYDIWHDRTRGFTPTEHYTLEQIDHIPNIDYIQFNLDYIDGDAEGRLQWNSVEGAPEIGMPGGYVVQQIGFELYLPRRVKNTSGVDIKNGEPIYITGGDGNNAYVALANASSYTTGFSCGFATEDIDDNAIGWVTIYGIVRGETAQPINTSTYSVGDLVYLDTTAGDLAATQPAAPNTGVILGYVWRSHATEGEIVVCPKVVPRLSYLSDVQGRGAESDEDMLQWNSSSLRWELIDVMADAVPSSLTLNTGTLISGTVSDVQAMYDGNTYHVDEVTGVPGYDIEFNFTGLTKLPTFIVVRWIYDGSSTHYCTWDIWNYDTSAWDQLRMYKTSEAYYDSMTMYIPQANSSDYISSGNAIIRTYHHTSGNASHDIEIDYVGMSHFLQNTL